VEVEALEWVLITSVSTKTLRAAWERRDWYSCRSLSEGYHQCLKTGCRIEQRQLQTAEGLLRLLGMLGPVAVQLLRLREVARLQHQAVALTQLPRELVAVVATLAEVPLATLTMERFWCEVARQGGYLAGVEMVHLAGRPFGAAGCTSRRCLKAFIWRATYLRKTCG
jgi:hypothetical protein